VSSARDVVLEVRGLAKTYRKPFSGRRVEAVKGISFAVGRGEIYGFLGPNGAGKTTTLKMLMGLVRPTHGDARIFGLPAPSHEALGRVGFLPENPYVYPYLTPREFVALCGRLNDVHGKRLEARVEACLDRVGIAYAADRAVRSLSKGMLQRTGLAAALVHEPELLVLDEPMSGLDPVGRKEVRDLIVSERAQGRTVFFSSHILSDVELLCDRGEVVLEGALSELLTKDVRCTEVAVGPASEDVASALRDAGATPRREGERWLVDVTGDEAVRHVLERALAAGARVESVTPKRETLEDVFVRRAL
jgi:ABC-2 type transport system ATP-binding protein